MTIFTPDDSEVTEIVLPDGSQASEVVAPDGSVVWTAAPDIPDSGVSRFEFEQNLTDSWGSFDLTGSGGLTYSTDSDSGSYALSLDGADDVAENSTGPDITNYTEFSVAALVKTTDNGWFYMSSSITDYNLAIAVNSGNLEAFEFQGGSFSSVTGSTSINDGTYRWLTTTVDYETDAVDLYVGDTNDGSGSFDGSYGNGDAHLAIGSNVVNNDSHLDALLADFRIYSKKLTGTEVSNLVNNGGING
jgi:hypothetical protein